ncbi:hypothetical protein M0R72_16590 [Candidatus Pacearchaeota archaeon]|jgi:hypothetical protein|nr:hypothetical protein [Candidatus Pacearchaeota archaeon]
MKKWIISSLISLLLVVPTVLGQLDVDIKRNTLFTGVPMQVIYLSLGILAFGLILVIFTGIVALKKNAGWDQEATRVFAVSVIVPAGLFLIVMGYSDQQIAPMFGLLGTILGYLIGKPPSKGTDSNY